MMKTAVPIARGVLCRSLTRSYRMSRGRFWEPCFQDCRKSASPLFFLFQQLSQAVKQSLSYWSLRGWHPHAHESVVGETVSPNGWDRLLRHSRQHKVCANIGAPCPTHCPWEQHGAGPGRCSVHRPVSQLRDTQLAETPNLIRKLRQSCPTFPHEENHT